MDSFPRTCKDCNVGLITHRPAGISEERNRYFKRNTQLWMGMGEVPLSCTDSELYGEPGIEGLLRARPVLWLHLLGSEPVLGICQGSTNSGEAVYTLNCICTLTCHMVFCFFELGFNKIPKGRDAYMSPLNVIQRPKPMNFWCEQNCCTCLCRSCAQPN